MIIKVIKPLFFIIQLKPLFLHPEKIHTMKKIIYLIVFFLSYTLLAQKNKSIASKPWNITVSANLLDSSGEASINPFDNYETSALGGVPIKISIEDRFSNAFGTEISASLNQWDAGKGVIDTF